ncbi:MAG: hypothetical protein MUF00_01515 [Gemmatimonadaceae bacterium]|jgi:hypothetical protein|nr:hypothetical protein [Gemmatimonadaceae bacterium]
MSDVVYVLEREQGEYADRTHALVLATLDKRACHRAVIYGPTIARIDAILRGES